MPSQDPPKLGAMAVLAFGCELAMIAILVAAGHGFASGWAGWVLGTILALIAVGIWGRWMAPTSTSRMENPARLSAQVALFIAVAIAAAFGGLPWWGVGFALVAIGVFASLLRAET